MALAMVQDILPSWPGWATLTLPDLSETSGQANGTTLTKNLADPLWNLHAVSRVVAPNTIRKWRAILTGLDKGKLFLGYDFGAFYPALYPNGSWPTGGSFDGVSATVYGLGDDGVSLQLAGLPNGFKGSIGDMISVACGDDDLKPLALFMVLEDFTTNGLGHTTSFEVRGAIPAGLAIGDTVAVKKPSCHMMIVPGSISIPDDVTGWGQISFDAKQVPTP